MATLAFLHDLVSSSSRRHLRTESTMSTAATIDREGTIEISPERPTAALVFAHGFGDTAHGWADTMAALAKDFPHVKFVLPTAAKRPVTLAGGKLVNAWFDVKTFGEKERKEAPWIDESRERLIGLIEKEVATGIPHSRIVLGGFSQGAAMSLYTGFQLKKAVLAGVICLSGRIPLAFSVAPETTKVPLFIGHGEQDPMLKFEMAQQVQQSLASQGVSDIEFHAYPQMKHSICHEELDDIRAWLQRVVPENADTGKGEL